DPLDEHAGSKLAAEALLERLAIDDEDVDRARLLVDEARREVAAPVLRGLAWDRLRGGIDRPRGIAHAGQLALVRLDEDVLAGDTDAAGRLRELLGDRQLPPRLAVGPDEDHLAAVVVGV